MRRIVWAVTATLVLTLVAGCDPTQPASTANPTTSTVSAAPSVRQSAPPSASLAPSASAPSQAVSENTWTGSFTAKKAKLETPKKVEDVTWKADDGTKNSGEGTISLTIENTTVRGTTSGALGAQVVSGILDGDVLRLSLLPKDPDATDAMTGTAMGEKKDNVIEGTLRATDAKGVVVREATFKLSPAKL